MENIDALEWDSSPIGSLEADYSMETNQQNLSPENMILSDNWMIESQSIPSNIKQLQSIDLNYSRICDGSDYLKLRYLSSLFPYLELFRTKSLAPNFFQQKIPTLRQIFFDCRTLEFVDFITFIQNDLQITSLIVSTYQMARSSIRTHFLEKIDWSNRSTCAPSWLSSFENIHTLDLYGIQENWV